MWDPGSFVVFEFSVDGILETGKLHKICEDYISFGMKPTPHIILSDGCSSSKDTDVGSRILVHLAKRALRRAFGEPWDCPVGYEPFLVGGTNASFGNMIINDAIRVVKDMGLPMGCLDATLIMAFVRDGYLKVFMYGDGYVFAGRNDFNLQYAYSEFNENCPYYLTYWADRERAKAHCAKVGAEGCTFKTNYPTDKYFVMSNTFVYDALFPLEHLKFLAISSDGINTFINTKQGGSVPFMDVAKEFLAFKNLAGEFVQRRVGRALKDYKKQDVEHLDDLSFGVIYIEERCEDDVN